MPLFLKGKCHKFSLQSLCLLFTYYVFLFPFTHYNFSFYYMMWLDYTVTCCDLYMSARYMGVKYTISLCYLLIHLHN